MHIDELKRILSEFNRDTLGKLLLEREQAYREPLIGAEQASVKIPTGEFPTLRGSDCFCGRTSKGYTSSGTFVDTCLTLSDPKYPVTKDAVAVGVVIDNLAHKGDLPVILAVGMNWGQGGYYINNPVPLVTMTSLRPRLQQVLKHLSVNNCPSVANTWRDNFHLIAANFFPWITSQPWSAYGFNSIEEATLIHCCGHPSPTEYLKKLLSKVLPNIVIFHGANNAVPYLGECVIREYLQNNEVTEFEVIFSDNLVPGFRPTISNGIKLGCCKQGRAALPLHDFDE